MRGGEQLTNDLVADEEIILRTLGGEAVPHPRKLLRRAIDAYAWATIRAEEANVIRAQFRDRSDRYKRRAVLLKQLALDLMLILGGETPVRATLATATLREAKAGVVITDEQQLADDFVDIVETRTPNKTRIKAALEAGEVVDGATMSNPMTVAVITRTARPLADVDLAENAE